MQKHLKKVESKTSIKQSDGGFIILIITLLMILVAVLALAYFRVAKAHH